MKKFFVLLFACALIAPTLALFGEEPQIEGLRPAPKVNLVKGAGKPVLLHTGKAITEADRKSIHELAIKSSAMKITGRHTINSGFPSITNTVTISPDKMYIDGLYTIANRPSFLEPSTGQLEFAPNSVVAGGSNLTFYVNVEPNVEYSFACKVRSPQPAPVFTITSWGGNDTVTGVHGDNAFAYAFVGQYQGVIAVSISANAYWAFLSCDITGTAF